MKRLKLFFACLLMAVLSIGQMWAELTNTYTKITSATSLDESAEYVIGNVDDYGCPTNTGGTSINTTEASWVHWSAKNVDGGFYLYNGSVYLKVPTSNAWGSGTSSDCSVLTTNNEGILSGNDGNDDRILVKNSNNAYLRWYKSGQTKAFLYKVEAASSTGGGQEQSGDGYVLVENTNQIGAGDYLIVYDNTYALNTHYGNTNANTYGTYVDVSEYYTSSTKTIASNSTTDALAYVVAETTNGYSIKRKSATEYLGCTTATNSGLRWDTEFTTSVDEWTLGVGAITSVEQTGRGIRWNNNSGQYRFATYATDGQKAIQLFKKVSTAKVEKPTISGDEYFVNNTSVELSCTTDGATIYYTMDGSDPKSGTEYTAALPISSTTTVKAIAKLGDDWSAVEEKTFHKAENKTVAEALEIINNLADNAKTEAFYCVHGVITGTPNIDWESTYKNATYDIKDAEVDNVLNVFRGKFTNNADFDQADMIREGDEVTVFGQLTKYVKNTTTTPEVAQGNYITVFYPKARLAWSANSFLADIDASENAFPTLTNTNSVTVTYSSSDPTKAEIDENTGAITLHAVGENITITASFAGNAQYKANSVTYTLNIGSSVPKGNITYNCDGATTCPENVLNATNLPAELPVVTKAGKNFGGWFTDADKTVPAVASAAISSDVTLYAKWLDPYTVAEALAIIDALADNGTIEGQYVSGVISQVDSYNSTYHSITYWISADGTTTSQLEVYSGLIGNAATPLGKEAFDAADNLEVGDVVTIYGTLKKYVKNETTTPEFDKNNTIYSFNRPVVSVTGVTLESTASVFVGGTVTLHASVVPVNAATKTINWSVESGATYASVANGVVTGIAEGTAVIRAASAEDANIYAECTVTVSQLPVWATTYTSNIKLSTEGGTSASEAKVKFNGEETEYDAIKAGTSGTAGAVVINVPAGATALHFHAYSWYNETVELTVSAPTGVTVTPSAAININQNSGISNNSPFTLEDGSTPQYDAYYAVSLSGNSEPVALTISVNNPTSGKRFVLFGVNQEGGLVLESISVGGTASVLEYTDGQHFDPTGLSVTGHYSDASTAPITEDIVWAFDPDPLTEGTTSVSVTATAAGFTSAAFVVNGLTVASAAPLSPWATTWTSNLDDITGSKVKFYGEETEYAALKAGTSGTAGTATLHIPAQATELHLHAYGWNTEDVTLSITAPAGVTVTPASLTLNRNSGFASNSPFTLAEGSTPQTDAYYALSLSGNTDAIELTISATEGKRFLLFGVNQVGGVVPVLESIEIKGDLTTKTGYKAGDALNLAGLTVEATYSLGGVAQTPVDITNDPELELTYSPLVENQTSVTITASYKGQTDEITITDLDPVASADPLIYVSKLNVNFASVEVGESVPAAETVTVTLTNVASVTATLGGTNADAFSVSPASLTESGDITISILANTDAAASYAATLTISDGEGGADDKTVNLSFTVNEPVVEDDVTGTWTLVTNATTLAAGRKVIIAQYVEADGAINTMAGQASNNRSVIASTVAGATLTPAVGTKVMTLADAGEGNFYLKTSDGEYLYNASTSSKSYLRTKAEEENVSWTIAVDAEGVATITSVENTNRTKMRYNPNTSGSPLFNCYASGQEDIALYMLEEDTPDYGTYHRDVTSGNYGTICLPKAGTIEGAMLYSIGSYEGGMIYVDEAGTTLEAGVPYIFYATASQLNVTYTSATVEETPGHANGLYGYYDPNNMATDAAAQFDIPDDQGYYILYQNAYWLVSGREAYINNFRAYIKISAITNVQQAPGIRRVAMQVNGQNTTTGVDALNAGDAPVKVMINGQLFILRGEKMYDAQGRLVK